MSHRIPVTFADWLFGLQECTPPDDWCCSICYDDPPEGDCPIEVDMTPIQLACGHIFDLGCLYSWTNGLEFRKGFKSHTTCPLCRVRLFWRSSRQLVRQLKGHHMALRLEFFDRHWMNRTASAWLTGSLQEVVDTAEGEAKRLTIKGIEYLYITKDWNLVIGQLLDAVTDKEGGFVGHVAVCDSQTVRFLSPAHEQHGRLWLELFLAMRIFREGFANNWGRTNMVIDFEKWFLQKAEQYESKQATLGPADEDDYEGLDVGFVALHLG
ncbi:hypothetical protein PMIN03_011238 [Paraphaeosphaeria minitans]|uniref:RING-type domain-containing protein n=1 Tax=Paraphaeosphaeria minitans TaxID=565426 RepID=A0A9P6GBJ2_9PLEO|nr:hypothetical protein PMIN01_09380 [Paraphaeosphaeria minitans]